MYALVDCANICILIYISVLPKQNRTELFIGTRNCLIRVCRAFPPLVEDVCTLLFQLGRVCKSEGAFAGSWAWPTECDEDVEDGNRGLHSTSLEHLIQATFDRIHKNAVYKRAIY